MVRDLDAHSWVEVYFADIGWVHLRPHAAAAPADPAGSPDAERAQRSPATRRRDLGAGRRGEPRRRRGRAAGPGGDGGSRRRRWASRPASSWWPLAWSPAARLLIAPRARARRPRRLGGCSAAELERRAAAPGLGVPAGTTLLALERRLGAAAVRSPRATPPGCGDGATRPPGAQPPGRGSAGLCGESSTGHRGLRARCAAISRCPGGPRPSRRSLASVKPAAPHSRP